MSQWPGEHYVFLAALATVLRPRLVVEIGTCTGVGTLSLQRFIPLDARLVTYDVEDWRSFQGTVLTEDDFDARLEQRLGDLSEEDVFERDRDLLAGARLVFVDGPKDGRFEPAFLGRLLPLLRGSGALLVIDDIRFLTMVQLWRDLPYPKLDVTSLAHYSGTGLVDLA